MAMRRRSAGVMMVTLGMLLLAAEPVRAQYSSGSTGADGPFPGGPFPVCTPTPCTMTVTVPTTGVFNFTTITVPAGVTVKFTRNAANTPVTLLATQNVLIAGTLDVSGSAGVPLVLFVDMAPHLGGAGGSGGFDG